MNAGPTCLQISSRPAYDPSDLVWEQNGANGAHLRTYPWLHAPIYTRCVRVYSVSPRGCRTDNQEQYKVDVCYRYRRLMWFLYHAVGNASWTDGWLRRTLRRVSSDEGMFLKTAYLFISLLWYSLSTGNATRRA